jgi:hypothetical protein
VDPGGDITVFVEARIGVGAVGIAGAATAITGSIIVDPDRAKMSQSSSGGRGRRDSHAGRARVRNERTSGPPRHAIRARGLLGRGAQGAQQLHGERWDVFGANDSWRLKSLRGQRGLAPGSSQAQLHQ